LIASLAVIHERRLRRIRDRGQGPALETIPDVAFGISGMTPGEQIKRIREPNDSGARLLAPRPPVWMASQG
jgi:hypothetical protein